MVPMKIGLCFLEDVNEYLTFDYQLRLDFSLFMDIGYRITDEHRILKNSANEDWTLVLKVSIKIRIWLRRCQ